MGVADPKYQMVSCLHVISDKIRPTEPAVADKIRNSFYSDDGILALYDEDEAIEITKKLVETLAEYGFICHKFSSNSKRVMEAIPKILLGGMLLKQSERKTKNLYLLIIKMMLSGDLLISA